MTPRDMARIGMMMANGGTAGGRQVVPAQWLERCVAQVASVDEVRRYGYQWYSGDVAFGKPKGWAAGRLERWWGGYGEGGQRLWILPELKLVVAVTAGNYGAEDRRGSMDASDPRAARGRAAKPRVTDAIRRPARPLSPRGRGREAMTYGRVHRLARVLQPRWRGRKSSGRAGEGRLYRLGCRLEPSKSRSW